VNSSKSVRSSIFAAAMILLSASLSAVGRAERVGYQFTGQMTPPLSLPGAHAPDTYTLFKIKVPVDASISGTFSYDTSTAGADGADNSRVFTQSIQGGLTFDVLGSNRTPLLHLVASEYTVTVNNDFLPDKTPSPIDSLKVDLIPPPSPVTANGANVTSTAATLTLPFNWDMQTFTGPLQPYLWTDLPPISYTTIGLIGTSSLGAFDINSLTRIQPKPGDFNVDGRVDANDYSEWRKVFGYTDVSDFYADGNNNGVVDDGDYVVWRDALSRSSTNVVSLPEPSNVSLVIIASAAVASFGRRLRWYVEVAPCPN
jgi:hypothetical protein